MISYEKAASFSNPTFPNKRKSCRTIDPFPHVIIQTFQGSFCSAFVLAFMSFPKDHRPKIHSTDMDKHFFL